MFAVPLKCVAFDLEDGSVVIDLKTIAAKREDGALGGPPCIKDVSHIIDGAGVCVDHLMAIVINGKLVREE